MESKNIGFSSVSLKEIQRFGTAVKYNDAMPKLKGQTRQVVHIGAEPFYNEEGLFGVNLARKIVRLKGSDGRMEEISAPAGHKIHFLDLIG